MKRRRKMKGAVMMRKISFFRVLALTAMVLFLASCDTGTKDDGKGLSDECLR